MTKDITEKTLYYVDGMKFDSLDEAESYASMDFPEEEVIDKIMGNMLEHKWFNCRYDIKEKQYIFYNECKRRWRAYKEVREWFYVR